MTLTVNRSRPEAPEPEGTAGSRGFWPLRDLPVVGWLLGVAIVSFVHQWVPAPRWLMIHLLLLGAAGHSILVWSRYFADTLTRLPATPRREQSQRLVLFNIGVLAVATGIIIDNAMVVGTGATGIVVAVLWHIVTLLKGLRGGLTSRFAFTLRFYLAAGLLLPVGVTLGTWLATNPGLIETRLRMAHASINLLGWIGLSVLGTIVTLGPTMLRTRIVEGSETRTKRALWVLLSGIGLIVAATLVDAPRVVAAGLAVYAVGTAMVGWGVAEAARRKPPVSFPTWSLGAGVVWLLGLLVWLAAQIALADDWVEAGKAFDGVVPYLAAGFVAQVLLGALSYLIPVVMGGGPAAVRSMNHDLDAGGALRVSLANVGLLICILPVPSIIRVITSLLVLLALAAFVPVLLRAVRRRHNPPADAGPVPVKGARPKGQNTGLAAVGLAMVVLAVALGGSLDTASLGGPAKSAADGVTPTGNTVEITVEARDMKFTPASVEVQAGDELVITVKNTDPVEVHDLVLETGHDSGRLAPGEEAVIDVGVVGRDLDGWCSVVGHRQMGMVFDITAIGGDNSAAGADTGADSTDSGDPASGLDGHGTHGGSTPGDIGSHGSGTPAADTVIPDPTLGPVPKGKVHRHTFEITEEKREIAPGVVQDRWMYNGTAPGPTLHGKVGDKFIITLVNRGKSGHSIDFHAGQRAPDKVMVTIPPGEELVYEFTATRSGIWMYHCSSMPMTAHIAAGLFGAVVIEPRDLPPVDKSFVLVQSENYYDAAGGPVDMAKMLDEKPDAVVFNGYHNAYQHEPIKAKVGERVRFWLLNAGPNRALSFHVVGGQFDRTYFEGDWVLGDASGPSKEGGAQALGLLAAQGGFVEMVLTEPGRYPLVNHIMIDAERGAYGIVEVSK